MQKSAYLMALVGFTLCFGMFTNIVYAGAVNITTQVGFFNPYTNSYYVHIYNNDTGNWDLIDEESNYGNIGVLNVSFLTSYYNQHIIDDKILLRFGLRAGDSTATRIYDSVVVAGNLTYTTPTDVAYNCTYDSGVTINTCPSTGDTPHYFGGSSISLPPTNNTYLNESWDANWTTYAWALGGGGVIPNLWIYANYTVPTENVSDAVYNTYHVTVNCTRHSATRGGSLVCSNEIDIPDDCINITTQAWTVIVPNNDTNLNSSWSFTRWTCNPNDGDEDHCDNLYETCTYPNFNVYPNVESDDYSAGSTATSQHIAVLSDPCITNEAANFSMIGRLYLACKSQVESGVHIDEEEQDCEHQIVCFNSNIMEEQFADCTSILTPCDHGCVSGVCQSAETTVVIDPITGENIEDTSYVNLQDYPAMAWVGLIFTPFSIITMMLVGVGAYMEQQVDDSKGVIFFGVLIVGVLAFTYLGLYPAWVGILITIACAGILTKILMGK